jgi:hypothetical protein
VSSELTDREDENSGYEKEIIEFSRPSESLDIWVVMETNVGRDGEH